MLRVRVTSNPETNSHFRKIYSDCARDRLTYTTHPPATILFHRRSKGKLPSRAANFLHTYACERTIEKTTDILAHLSRCLRLAHVAHPSYPYSLPSIPLLAIPPVLHDLLQRACNMNSGSCKKLKRSKPPLVAKASLCGDPHAGHLVTSFGGPQSLH